MTVRMSNVSAVVSSLMAARSSCPRSNVPHVCIVHTHILDYGTPHTLPTLCVTMYMCNVKAGEMLDYAQAYCVHAGQ